MKKFTQALPSILVLTSLFFLTGCKKVYDYIQDHYVIEHKLCRVDELMISIQGEDETVKFSYDAYGNPVSALIVSPEDGTYKNLDYRFRYDQQKRLTDFYYNFPGNTGVLVWHRYSYPDKFHIVDTAFTYAGEIDDPEPPHDAESYHLRHYELDAAGRIIKSTEYNEGLPPSVSSFNYSQDGNLIYPNATYDDKVNIYRTNKVWMLIFADYSVNNPTGNDNIITQYNNYGLPVKFKADPTSLSGTGNILGYEYEEMQVIYKCKGEH